MRVISFFAQLGWLRLLCLPDLRLFRSGSNFKVTCSSLSIGLQQLLPPELYGYAI